MRLLERAESWAIDPALGTLDGARSWALRQGASVARLFVRRRDFRVLAGTAFACASALIATVLAPGWTLLFGPIVFGMPHLVFEARYLFFQQPSSRALVLIVAAQIVSVLAGTGIYTLGLACLAALAREARRAPAFYAWCFFAACVQLAAIIAPTWSRFLLLHVHNCAPIAVWLFWRKRPAAVSIAVVATFLACATAILCGAFDGLPLRTPLRDEVFSLTRLTDAVAGGFGGPWRARLLLFFGFTQAVHYAVWLRLIPEEARARETPRSWSASWEAFKRDSGSGVALLAIAATIAVPLMGIAAGMVRTRSLYVTFSEFHATVEVILVVLLFQRRPVICVDRAHHAAPANANGAPRDAAAAGSARC